MTVVIFAQDCDAPVDQVIRQLTDREVPVFRADTSWFPQRLIIDARLESGRWVGCLSTDHHRVDLDDIRSIWYRDPTAFDFPANLSQPERRFAFREARLGLGGVLASLDTLWVNHPNRASDAVYKPLQLATAVECGLAVPRTLVTNDATAVRRFHAESGPGLICKVFGSNTIAEEGTLKVAYTHRLDDGDLTDLHNVSSTAHQFQDWVHNKHHEARVIVVGDRIFPVLIHAGSAASRIDWRTDYTALRYELTELPAAVENGVRLYMAAFGLAYAAFDFAIDAAGKWFFLEANTAGQYGFLETNTGAAINDALADLLAGGVS
ncbi:MAG: ATP-grasp ribosomal peptide maturase [Pseudonocardiaceae bacterium]